VRTLAKFIGEQQGANGGGAADSFRSRIEERTKLRQSAMTIRRRGAMPNGAETLRSH
jgi:hypothetical protein